MCCDWVEQARGNMFEVEWYLWAAGGSGEEARGMVIGIGLHGMTVKLPAAYGRGSMVDFEVWLAPSHSIRVVGEVVCREYSRHNFYLHVEFRVMREEDRTSLESTLRQMRRELPPNPTGGSAYPFICPN